MGPEGISWELKHGSANMSLGDVEPVNDKLSRGQRMLTDSQTHENKRYYQSNDYPNDGPLDWLCQFSSARRRSCALQL